MHNGHGVTLPLTTFCSGELKTSTIAVKYRTRDLKAKGSIITEPTGPSPTAQSVALRSWEQEVAVSIQARPLFFPRIDDSHCDRIHFSLTAVRCFDNGYVGKQPVAWKEYCVDYWLKELH